MAVRRQPRAREPAEGAVPLAGAGDEARVLPLEVLRLTREVLLLPPEVLVPTLEVLLLPPQVLALPLEALPLSP